MGLVSRWVFCLNSLSVSEENVEVSKQIMRIHNVKVLRYGQVAQNKDESFFAVVFGNRSHLSNDHRQAALD